MCLYLGSSLTKSSHLCSGGYSHRLLKRDRESDRAYCRRGFAGLFPDATIHRVHHYFSGLDGVHVFCVQKAWGKIRNHVHFGKACQECGIDDSWCAENDVFMLCIASCSCRLCEMVACTLTAVYVWGTIHDDAYFSSDDAHFSSDDAFFSPDDAHFNSDDAYLRSDDVYFSPNDAYLRSDDAYFR